MPDILTGEQQERAAEFRKFSAEQIAPFAPEWDRAQEPPLDAVARLGRAGFFGVHLPARFGGRGWDTVSFGLLCEALGRADAAIADMVTVQAMVAQALARWGTEEQRGRWLPPLARGDLIGAFALTEPEGGSDIQATSTRLRRDGREGGLILSGEKLWISSGQIAGLFLVFGRLEDKPAACLVPRGSAGLEIEPIRDLLGFRAAGLARLRFHDVAIPPGDVVGPPGFAFSHVAAVGLHHGRIGTASSAAGLLRGCLEESADYAVARRRGAGLIADLGMIQSLLARMGADCEAAQLLCWRACRAEDERLPEASLQACVAKYFASRAAVRAAADAVQIHGAAGCREASPAARFYRDAKIMEIIEGTTQVQEQILARGYAQEALGRRPASPTIPSAQPCSPAASAPGPRRSRAAP